ncbi:unnamed protein product [Clonostachys rosea]|uniref:1-alkyl-2-acetylglycerophosphocholine esterase n=1 Tax=Bionectria ochroleuca TaxID=29856 RepID=A0ABY6UWV7_BIOOC|nr:unnamed protein product [Clonostachys rosea]
MTQPKLFDKRSNYIMHFLFLLLPFSFTSAASLPNPDGPYNVGYSQHIIPQITLNDPTPGPGNAILSHLYFPTHDSNRSSPRDNWGDALELLRGLLDQLTTELRRDASFLSAPTGDPTVLFSPAAGFNAWMYKGLLAGLASHGYTVLAIDHPGEPPVVRWPNGTDIIGLSIEVYEFRVTDLAAVLAWFPTFVRNAHALFDTSRLLALGHSMGGSASVTFAPDHQSVEAAVNLDGGFSQQHTVLTNAGLPVLLKSSIYHTTRSDPSWAEFQEHQTGWWEHIAIYGSGHLDYSDIATWSEALGLPPLVQSNLVR